MLDVETRQSPQQTFLPILPLDYGSIPEYCFHPHTLAIWEQALGENPFDWLIPAGRDTVVISPDHKTGIRQYGDVVQIFAVTGDPLFPTQENLLASYNLQWCLAALQIQCRWKTGGWHHSCPVADLG